MKREEREVLQFLSGMGIKVRPNATEIVTKQFLAVRNKEDNNEEFDQLLDKWGQLKVLDINDLQDKSDIIQIKTLQENCEIFVFDVFKDIKKEIYYPESKKFFPSREKPSLIKAPQGKASMYLDRFLISKDRIKSSPNFSSHENSQLINSIDSLVGCRTERIVLGILTKTDSNDWILEDSSSSETLDLSHAGCNVGFFCEGCIVLVQGRMDEKIFKASCLAQPPTCWILDTPYIIPNNKWLVPWPDHALIVLMSNVHFDELRVLQSLDKIFEVYSNYSNVMFVFIGNFNSQKNPALHKYTTGFENLVDIIEKYEILRSTGMWVFVPGPNDPGLGEFMPRREIPPVFVEPLRRLEKVKVTSNPTRIGFCGKKIVIARTDQMRKMQRSTAVESTNEENLDPENFLAHTLVKQAHVCPSLHTPILPDYDYALRLDQKVDFICVAENSKNYHHAIDGVNVFSPGHFSRYSSFCTLSGKNLEIDMRELDNS
ncbi:hypothetical protein SteCoe_28412 [Stentor coeruleus]|uniref:DNA polymerase II subunit 2 n=1 Tax=Stentor coeruleus TaxID=5963 RepID=A0A1R2B895_9CILI|nr:hypothetical protein SteCoe_28412 [Stentor coeruleus]